MSESAKSGKQQHLADKIKPALLTWDEDSTPIASDFDDVYYSKANGLAETRYVFLAHNQLPQRWSELDDKESTCFTVIETGFGTGLNFLATFTAWQQQPLKKARLHYVSIEKHPLTSADLRQALAQWPDIKPAADVLITQYPPLVPGFHRVEFCDHRVHLTLIFADVTQALGQLQASADAWYLDGFAPSKNPTMWEPPLYEQMARLSKPGTTYATFTAAGMVRRGLAEAGFSVSKCKGFGRKREMICGAFNGNQASPEALPVKQNPWYQQRVPPSTNHTIESALVIGAGLAGSASAYALAQRGIRVTVLEQHNTIAREASGNPAGITFTRLSPFDVPQNRFYQKAYLYAVAQLEKRMQQSGLQAGTDYEFNGVMRFAFSEKEEQAQQALLQSGLWPESIAENLTVKQCTEKLGFECRYGGLFLKKGGWLTPADLCRFHLNHENITVLTQQQVQTLNFTGNQWVAITDTDSFSADALVVANGFGANKLAQLSDLPLRSVRGQITYVPSTPASSTLLKHALNYEGYITPAKEGFHCVGATFHPKSTDTEFHAQDHDTNLTNLQHTVPSLANTLFEGKGSPANPPLEQGRVAFRCQTPDYLPMIGPMPNIEDFKSDYNDLRKGIVKRDFPLGSYLPNCYVNLAHGSRGITSSLMGAEIIACFLNSEPQPLDQEVLDILNPARFIIRGLKRKQL